jgi:hypothetical protein
MTRVEKLDQLNDLLAEVDRVRARIDEYKEAIDESPATDPDGFDVGSYNFPRESAALKRATLDLTRALAQYRKRVH